MRAGDFALRGRQMFGMILPGVVFAFGVCLLAGVNPISVIESGNTLVRSVAFVTIGYVLWAPIQGVIMIALLHFVPSIPAYKDLFASDEVVARTETIIGAGELARTRRLEVCKWYIRHYSPALSSMLDEMEADINMLVGMPLALMVFLEGAVRAVTPAGPYSAVWLFIALLPMLGALFLTFVFFNRLAVEERRAWCEMVIVVAKSQPPIGPPAQRNG